MSEELDEIVDNLREPSAWIRIVFMLGFALLLYLVLAPVMLVLMFVQALFSIFTGEDNYKLRGLGAGLTEFVTQILSFLTYNSEEKPFPFADFPEMTLDADDDRAAEAEKTAATASSGPEKKKPAKKKAAIKKASPRKKTVADKKPAAEKKSASKTDTANAADTNAGDED